jgi:hypothetical protein
MTPYEKHIKKARSLIIIAKELKAAQIVKRQNKNWYLLRLEYLKLAENHLIMAQLYILMRRNSYAKD